MTEDSDAPPSAVYVAKKFNEHLKRISPLDRPFELWDFYSGNTSLRRDVLLEVGAFDDDFRLYGNEDLDLFLRLRAAQVDIRFEPAARALQHHCKDFAQLAADAEAAGRTAVQLLAKHPNAFAELALGRDYVGTPIWRPIRGVLIACADRWERLPAVIISFTRWLERRRLRRVTVYFRHVLDFFYWKGAHDAMGEPWSQHRQVSDAAT